MPRVRHHCVAASPIDAVFGILATVRFRTEWHPATRGVEGDTGHLARLGDRIIEHLTVAGIEGSGAGPSWRLEPGVEAYYVVQFLGGHPAAGLVGQVPRPHTPWTRVLRSALGGGL